MPKITIKTLPLDNAIIIPEVLTRLGKSLSRALDISPDRLVILWDHIKANHFLFNGKLASIQTEHTHHPIIEIMAVEGMPRDLEKKMIHTIVENLSRELSIDVNNFCVCINTLAPGKLFVFGRFIKGSTREKPVILQHDA